MEIADEKAFWPLVVTPVERTNAMHAAWSRVCHSILSELDLRNCRLVECYRSGYSSNKIENQVTITVTADRGYTKKWRPFREGVVEILKRFDLVGIAVRITIRRVIRAGHCFNRGLPDDIWSRRARTRASIISNSNSNESDTFGGYIELKNKKRK